MSSEATLVYFIAGSDSRPVEMGGSPHSEIETPNSVSLSEVVPTLLKHSTNNRELAYPYSIYEPTAGAPLSSLSVYLSLPERRLVDRQVGSMARALASLTSPNGTFGTVSQVIANPFAIRAPTAPPVVGSQTWSEAFNNLLEGILRDGEDLNVLLPYESVRAHYQRLSWHLDAVTLPRLVILDIGNETNVMVDRGLDANASSSSTGEAKVTGLRSWGLGVFGDPLLSDSFEEPKEGFIEGWRAGEDEDIIEDEANSEVRLLLYQCYRAVVSIVTEHYRPQLDSSRRELDGRRKLTSALAELEKVEVAVSDALKRSRSLSIETSGDEESAKRQKLDVQNS